MDKGKNQDAPTEGAIDLDLLPTILGTAIRRAAMHVMGMFTVVTRETGIRPGQFSMLVVLNANPGLSQSELAEATGIERPHIATRLADLEQKGYVKSEPLPKNRRKHEVTITPKGRQALNRALELVEEIENDHKRRIGEDRAKFLLETLHDLVKKE